MENFKKRLILSFIINLLMIIFFISSMILTLVDVFNNPDTIYQTFWGVFRYFTNDGNLLSCIFNFIIVIKQIQVLRKKTEKEIKEKTISHFLYIISLFSAVSEIVIFIVVVLIFLPMAPIDIIKALIGTYKASSVHITIPLLLTFRFLFLDQRKRQLKIYEKFFGGIPMLIYGIIMYILCGAKVFTSFDKKYGDAKIPYPFFDLYHQSWYFCFFIGIFIFIFGFGISFLFDLLNKKCEKLIFPYDSSLDNLDSDFKEEKNLLSDSLSIEESFKEQ